MNLHSLSKTVHAANIKWWQDPHTGKPINRNKGELIALIHSEISEACDARRELDDKLPNRYGRQVEIVDAIIRCLDYAGGFNYKLSKKEYSCLDIINTKCKRFDFIKIEDLHSQCSKLLEAERKGKCANKILLVLIKMLCEYLDQQDFDVQETFDEKMAFNAKRVDHTHEHRTGRGGKKF